MDSRQPLEVPPELARRLVSRHGAAARAWLDRLPGIVAGLAERWSLQVGPPFPSVGSAAWVAPAGEVDGLPVVLKVSWPHREARSEAAGLRFFDGRGAVRVVRADEDDLALLVERCVPGSDLWTLPLDEGNEVAAGVLRTLWRPAPPDHGPIEDLALVAREWVEEFRTGPAGYPERMRAQAGEVAGELLGTQRNLVVLHGDFNPGNVLASGRGWLGIDCKPLVGEPAYDLAQLLYNRVRTAVPGPAVDETARQVDLLARRLDLDASRISRWAFVKAVAWRWGPEVADVFAAVARVDR